MFKLVVGKLSVDMKLKRDRKRNQYHKSDVTIKMKIRYDEDYIDVDIDKGKIEVHEGTLKPSCGDDHVSNKANEEDALEVILDHTITDKNRACLERYASKQDE